MANITISQLPSASALTGSEVLPVVQSGSTKKTTVQAIADLAGGGGGGTTLDITTVGTIGTDTSINFNSYAYVSGSASGAQQYPVVPVPNINIYAGGYGSGVASLSFIEFPTLTRASYFTIGNFQYLETISAPELLSTYQLQATYLPAINNISFPKVTKVEDFVIGSSSPRVIQTLNFPLLSDAKFNFSYSYSNLTNKLNSTTFPALTRFACYFGNVYDLGEVEFTGVTNIGGGGINANTYNSNLTKFSFPNLVTIEASYISITSCYGLSYFRFGTAGILKSVNNGSSFNFQSNAFDQASVDSVLLAMASLDGTNGTTATYSCNLYLNGGSNSAPSSAGYAAVSVLQSRGWYVGTN